MREDPAFGTKEPVQSVRASFELVGYDGIGVTLRMLVEGERPFLVPWSAVLKSATKYDARPFVSASCQNSSQPWTCWWYSSALCYCQPDLDEEQRHDNL